jgi:hypothetical protein
MSYKNLKPVLFRGEVVPGYFIDPNGNIFSDKRGYLTELTVSNYNDQWNPYPRVGLTINGKNKTIMVHRLVCETFHKKPLPDILTKEEWDTIFPEIREKLIKHIQHADRYQVNHIDHNHHNYHPSNLEWVTAQENQQKYQKHKRKA